MKILLTLTAVVFSLGVMAQEDLNSMKQKANSHIDKKMSSLRTAKDCVGNASSQEAFKACKYDMHEDMKAQKMEKMEELKNQKESED